MIGDDFNPLTATSGDLKKYGFPAKPTDTKNLVIWENAMKNARQYVKPIQIPALERYNSVLYPIYNHLWAGYKAYTTIILILTFMVHVPVGTNHSM